MSALTFDTLKFANRLKEAGVPPAQAEAEAAVLAEALESNTRELATKADLDRVKLDLQRDLKEMEMRLTIKLGTLLAIVAGLVVTLQKIL